LKILIIGSAKRWRMEKGVERALRRAGHNTRLIDDKRAKRLIGRTLTQRWALLHARRFKPDFVFLSKCQALDLKTVEQIIAGRDNSMWYHDPPSYRHIDRPHIAHLAAVGRLARAFFVSGFVDEWAALGLPAKFLPSCADIALGPTRPDRDSASQVAFIGTGYDATRARFLIDIARKFDVKVWGPGWEQWRQHLRWNGRGVYGRAFARVCSSASIVLGINPVIGEGATNYSSDRAWVVIYAGGFYLGQASEGVTSLLRGGTHCAWYRDLDDCVRKIGHYLEDSTDRERIRREGHRFVREHHTYDQRIENLLSGEEFVNPLG